MHDWWSPLLGMIIGFLFAWGVFELTEHRRRKRAQAAVRRALVAELGQAELVLSAIVFNLSIGTDHVADAVQELRWILQLGTERILRQERAHPGEQRVVEREQPVRALRVRLFGKPETLPMTFVQVLPPSNVVEM